MKITQIHARQILDSRGNPTVEADVVLDSGVMGRAAVPSGASTGTHEAVELRDGDTKKYNGKGVEKAVANVNTEIREKLLGMSADDQGALDRAMIELDGTTTKSRLGANAILSVSLAAAHAAALEMKKPLYQYVHDISGAARPLSLPLPMVNIINGGKHAEGSTDIQEFMVLPIGVPSFSEAVHRTTNVFHSLGKVLKKHGYRTTVGDEGGYAPSVKAGNKEALFLIKEAVSGAGYELGTDIALGLDVASSELFQNGSYNLATEGKALSSADLAQWYDELSTEFPIVSIEDGCAEDDWDGWKELTRRLGSRVQLVGDDLLVTNTEFLKRAISEKAGNAILIKVNQIGTLTETIAAVALAQSAGWNAVISHRSGETEDTTIAHLVVGLGTGQIKTGSMSRTDRIAKYNELLRIEEALGSSANFINHIAH